jgi:hypothetical protein
VAAGPAVVHEGARTDESALLSTLKATSGWRRHAANEWLLPIPDEIVAMAVQGRNPGRVACEPEVRTLIDPRAPTVRSTGSLSRQDRYDGDPMQRSPCITTRPILRGNPAAQPLIVCATHKAEVAHARSSAHRSARTKQQKREKR